jgi:hypothetical protein
VRRKSQILQTCLGSEKDSDPVRNLELVTVTEVVKVKVQELGTDDCEEYRLGEDQLALGFVKAKGSLAEVTPPPPPDEGGPGGEGRSLFREASWRRR